MEGRLQAKTGTLSGVKSLSGYLPSQGGQIEFVLILNEPGADGGSGPVWNAFGVALASFPGVVSVAVGPR